jgi:hypothetical protein
VEPPRAKLIWTKDGELHIGARDGRPLVSISSTHVTLRGECASRDETLPIAELRSLLVFFGKDFRQKRTRVAEALLRFAIYNTSIYLGTYRGEFLTVYIEPRDGSPERRVVLGAVPEVGDLRGLPHAVRAATEFYSERNALQSIAPDAGVIADAVLAATHSGKGVAMSSVRATLLERLSG